MRQAVKPLRDFVSRAIFDRKGSKGYWENRYATGGNSGGGSYGRLAKYKAEVLNGLIAQYEITSIIELGCGDGNQASLMEAKEVSYLGLDISATAIAHNLARFKTEPKRDFLAFDSTTLKNIGTFLRADMTLSLDVLYHLIEGDVYESYLHTLFGMAAKYVVIYASDNDAIKVNVPHVRIRKFTPYVQEKFRDFELVNTIRNRYHSDDPTKSGTDEWSWSDFFVYRRTTSLSAAKPHSR